MEQKNNLPTLADLHSDPAAAFKNDQFKTLLNLPPSESWLKKHPMAKTKNDQGQSVPSSYMPIDKVEFMLDVIFQEWRIEVLAVQVMFQSIAVTVRVHYLNPVTGVWSYHDGVGAKSVQVNKGASAADLGQIKDAAVQMALPSAKSYALKDACEHLGAIFGRNLNRQHTLQFAGSYGPQEEETPMTTVDPPAPYGPKNFQPSEVYPKQYAKQEATPQPKQEATPPKWGQPQMWDAPSQQPESKPANDAIRTQIWNEQHKPTQPNSSNNINLSAL